MYSIGQLSKKTNISIRTLRYYDEIGLLKPAKVADSGYRYYSNFKALRSSSDTRDKFLAKHFTEHELEIIKSLPDLSANDPRSMEWAKLIRKVKEHIDEPPSSAISRNLAAQIVNVSMEWFQQDEELIEKYWSMIRPEDGKETQVFGMDADVMDHIDRIVDWYLQHVQEENDDGGKNR